MKKIILTLLWGIIGWTLSAQYSNTIYFDKQNYRQHHLNPAFQPQSKLYVGVPMLSSLSLGGGNTDLTLMDLFKKVNVDGEERTVLFFDKCAPNGVNDFLNTLKGKEQIHGSYQIDLFDAGYRVNDKISVNFGVSNKMDANVAIPEAIFAFLFKGMENGEVFDFNLNKLAIAADMYTEIAGGISVKATDRISLGLKAKYLIGNGSVKSNLRNVSMIASEEEWHITGHGGIWTCIPNFEIALSDSGTVSEIQLNGLAPLKAMGHGFGLDAGLAIKVTDHINLSASILDFGCISWGGNIQELQIKEDFIYKGLEYEISKTDESSGWWGPYKESLKNLLTKNQNPEKYTSWLTAKLLVGGEVSLLEDMLSIGVLSKTHLQKNLVREELLLSGNVRVNEHFSGTFTYNFFDGWNNIGIGLNGNIGPINLFAAMDHIPLRYAKISGHKIPCYVRDTRLSVGLGVVIGYQKDSKWR